MKTSNTLFGILPAVVTPFAINGEFAESPFEQLLARLYESGVDGVYLCGSTGEGLLQPVAQRKRIAEAAMRNSPRGKQIIVHVGASTTREALELAAHAASVGATAISSLPPLTGNYSFGEIVSYYETLAQNCPLPLVVYYFPELAPAIHSADQLRTLCTIEGVAGAKFTSYDLLTMSQLKRDGVVVYYGRDEMLAAGLLFGADGGIGTFYSLVPWIFTELFRLAQQGRWQEAMPLQAQVNELIRISLQYPLYPVVKELLRWTGIDCGPCLAPRRQYLTQAEVNRLRSEIEDAGLTQLVYSTAGAP
jgi:N-acetylneuraminate lyase